jgi:hypothetical protein
MGIGGFAFLSAEITIAVPAETIASVQVAPDPQSAAAPSRYTPVGQLAQVGAAETPSFGSAYPDGARKPDSGACRYE